MYHLRRSGLIPTWFILMVLYCTLDYFIFMCAVGSSEAGGKRASRGGEGRAQHRDAGERPGGVEEERRGDQSAGANRGQRTFPTGEEEEEDGGCEGPRKGGTSKV